jgi:hypothetical protein
MPIWTPMADPQYESSPAANRGEGASEAVFHETVSKDMLSKEARSPEDLSREPLPCDDLSNAELVTALQADRLWLLRQLDSGAWPEWRLDLAALERELGELLDRVAETAE